MSGKWEIHEGLLIWGVVEEKGLFFTYVDLLSYCVCSVLCDAHHLLIRVGKEDMLTISGNGQL